jgi:hypothetical protein
MNTTKEFLTEKVAAALSARYCFFDEGFTNYEEIHKAKFSLLHLMFKWEFDRATNKASPILDMANWTYNSYEATQEQDAFSELVFCLGEDDVNGGMFYISGVWDETHSSIHWFLNDKARYTD